MVNKKNIFQNAVYAFAYLLHKMTPLHIQRCEKEKTKRLAQRHKASSRENTATQVIRHRNLLFITMPKKTLKVNWIEFIKDLKIYIHWQNKFIKINKKKKCFWSTFFSSKANWVCVTSFTSHTELPVSTLVCSRFIEFQSPAYDRLACQGQNK